MPLMSTLAHVAERIADLARFALKCPVWLYRWTLKPFVGHTCRHAPSCSEYALEAIDVNGAWKGGWLALSRLSRCRPGGTHGFDPVPDLGEVTHRFAPWRYGRWTGAHLPAND